jgi:hypothetical protein
MSRSDVQKRTKINHEETTKIEDRGWKIDDRVIYSTLDLRSPFLDPQSSPPIGARPGFSVIDFPN